MKTYPPIMVELLTTSSLYFYHISCTEDAQLYYNVKNNSIQNLGKLYLIKEPLGICLLYNRLCLLPHNHYITVTGSYKYGCIPSGPLSSPVRTSHLQINSLENTLS